MLSFYDEDLDEESQIEISSPRALDTDADESDACEVFRRMAVTAENSVVDLTPPWVDHSSHDVREKLFGNALTTHSCSSTKFSHNDLPTFMLSDAINALSFSSTKTPAQIWDCVKQSLSSKSIIITHDDKWTIDGCITVEGALLEITVALYQGPGESYTVVFNMVKGDLNQFVALVDEVRRNCNTVDNVEEFDFGKVGNDEFWGSRDGVTELYPGSMDMDHAELALLLHEMGPKSHIRTRIEAAKAFAAAMRSEKNRNFLAQNDAAIAMLLSYVLGDEPDLQRFSVYILMQITKHHEAILREWVKAMAVTKIQSYLCKPQTNGVHVTTTQLLNEWMGQLLQSS